MSGKDRLQEKYQSKYILEGLSCASCAHKIEKSVQELSCVAEADLNFALNKITISGQSQEIIEMDNELQRIVSQIEDNINVKKDDELSIDSMDNKDKQVCSYLKCRFWPGVFMFVLAVILFEFPGIAVNNVPYLLLYIKLIIFGSSYLLIGGPVLLSAIRNIKRGQVFDENFLMTVATLGAFAVQAFPEAVAVMLFYNIGEMFQNKAVNKARRSLKEVMSLKPEYANLKAEDGIKKVKPEKVKPGDIIIIKAGEKVPLDGQVIEGSSLVDTSALTGESLPRHIDTDDKIMSGMINKEGLLTVRVSKDYEDSTVARILELVENASEKKAPTEKFITKFARYYTPVVVLAAAATAVIPPLFIEGAAFSDWFYRALIFLVISCPCALVISIPLGFFGGIGLASHQGILVKGGNYLEGLNDVRQVIFDKTGTLTRGEFSVNQVEAYNGYTAEEVLAKAALAESHSEHPIAKSIIEAYEGKIDTASVEDYQEISGQGINAIIDGRKVLAGNYKLMRENEVDCQSAAGETTVVYLAVDNKCAGYITITDKLKESSMETIKKLKEIGIHKLVMLTGDREGVANRTASELGIDEYYAELLPDEKVDMVEKLLNENKGEGRLAFVGDGINDAPVLARSDIGVAMGGLGSDAAIEAADIVLMTDEPLKLVTAFETAAKTRKIVWQNIIMALGVKGIFIFMGVLGVATMWEAVFADVGVALLAVFNAMRLSRSL